MSGARPRLRLGRATDPVTRWLQQRLTREIQRSVAETIAHLRAEQQRDDKQSG